MRRSGLAGTILLAGLLLTWCQSPPDQHASVPRVAGSSISGRTIVPFPSETEGGLDYQLHHGAAVPEDGGSATRSVPGTPLTAEETEALLQRLPPLPPAPPVEEFHLPPQSPPAPRTGRTIERPFPPSATGAGPPPEAATTTPTVLRVSPNGDVEMAARVSVTFSHPIVALSTHDDLRQQPPPVRLSPEVPGRWDWIGTETIVFRSDAPRLPMATEFTVTVPRGTPSATGSATDRETVVRFATPAPRLTSHWPRGGVQPLDPVIVLAFDQPVDGGAVAEGVVIVAGRDRHSVRPLTPDELARETEKDRGLRAFIAGLEDGRWAAVRPSEKLPRDRELAVTVRRGLTGLEGPRATAEDQAVPLRTHGPFEVVRHGCSWGSDCPPESDWYVELTNPIDEDRLRAGHVRLEPPLSDVHVTAHGNRLHVAGRFTARTDYRLTLDSGLRDAFGQRLGKDRHVTLSVGSPRPELRGPGGPLVVLEATERPVLPIVSRGHRELRVRVHSVEPRDYERYLATRHQLYRNRDAPLPGRVVMDEKLAVAGGDDHRPLAIDLSPALREGRGHAIVQVDASKESRRHRVGFDCWVQVTGLGLNVVTDSSEVVAWVTALADGQPITGAEVSLGASAGRTDGEGLARLSRPEGSKDGLLLARHGDDVAFLSANGSHWTFPHVTRGPLWYVFDDRGIYRPGETVHVKGLLRELEPQPGGDLRALSTEATEVTYSLRGPRGNDLADGTAPLDDLGTFDLTVTLPRDANLGQATLQLRLTGDRPQHHHAIQVQEFRKPEYEVTVEAGAGPHRVGDEIDAGVEATYYSGGGLAHADVTWRATSRTTSYRPPGWEEFVFGRWRPWWWRSPGEDSAATEETLQATTDRDGRHRLRVEVLSVDPPLSEKLTLEATVQDVNRQARAGSTSVIVHPSRCHVGVRVERAFVDEDEPLTVDVIVTDVDGRPLPERNPKLTLVRPEWRRVKGEWTEVEESVGECSPESGEEPVACRFDVPRGGRHLLRAVVEDEDGRPSLTERTIWVAGAVAPVVGRTEVDEVELVPDHPEHAPGDVARILVTSPFLPAEGLVTFRRAGVMETRRISLKDGTHSIELPITEAHVPNVHVRVELVGRRQDESGRDAVAQASGSLELRVSPVTRTIDVAVAPRAEQVEPGAETVIDVELRGADARPIEGQVALLVVDEAVLSLLDHEIPDPLALFYANRGDGTFDLRSRDDVIDTELAEADGAPWDLRTGGGGGMHAPRMAKVAFAAEMADVEAGGSGGPEPLAVRAFFDALAAWHPAVRTDAQGRAAIPITLPDSLTRYRVVAVAVDGVSRFGKGEAPLTARLPLMVRPAPPRFLNHGDRFELPVVVHNQTGEALDVDIVVRGQHLDWPSDRGRRATVPADDRIEVLVPAAAAGPGTARLQVGVVAGSLSDAWQGSLPVYTPATTEAFAVHGDLAEGAVVQPVALPSDAWPEFGGLSVTTSSTAVASLTDAVAYLVEYPFECAEQLASRVLGITALTEVLAAFEADGLPDPNTLRAAVDRDVRRLAALQRHDGGFGLWSRDDESWPYASVHAVHALARARAEGFSVPADVLERGRSYLDSIERRFPERHGKLSRQAITAYALNVQRAHFGVDPRRASRLVDEAGGVRELPLEAAAWLAPVLAADRRTAALAKEAWLYFESQAEDTAGAATFTTSYAEDAYLLMHSDRRTDAVILGSLLELDAEHDLVPKVARGLLAHRVRGRWRNTQENGFVLLALERYFRLREGVEPDFVARAWLGDDFVGSSEFRGRSTARHVTRVPMSFLTRESLDRGNAARDLVLSKDGPGRLYYRLGLRHAPRSPDAKPLDRGFAVERTYEPVDSPDDVTRDEDGTWRVRAGARVRARVTVVNTSRRYHAAVVDPLPAGFEPLNPVLQGTGELPPTDPKRPGGWWWWRWYEHQNLRDDRAEAFASLLWEGVHEQVHDCRATTPGRFVVPPAKAEEMYAPETFGRSSPDVVIVE